MLLRSFTADKVPAPRASSYVGLRDLVHLGQPLDLEIGCGVGWHPIQYCRQNSDRSLVALERTSRKFAAFARRLRSHLPLPNLLAMQADAVSWLTHAPAEIKFSRVFLFYPNPEPQNPAQRWIRMPFFASLLDRLTEKATITLCTNEAFYATEVEEVARKHWRLQVKSERIDNRTKPDFIPRTHFEKKYFERGEVLHQLELIKGTLEITERA